MTAPSLFDTEPTGWGAVISDDGRYRYRLGRIWDATRPAVVFCMLNPSTADAVVNDPTIRRCIGFAKAWGYGGLIVVNLFAFRATDPAELNAAGRAAVGPLNNDYLVGDCAFADVVCAWGASLPKYWTRRPAGVLELLREHGANLHHLGLTKSGQPRHPLYLPSSLTPTRWNP